AASWRTARRYSRRVPSTSPASCMSWIRRFFSSDIVIPFRAWGPKISSHNGRKSQGITPDSFDGQIPSILRNHPARSPHPAAKPLRPMPDGRWQMPDGRWQVPDGRWQVPDGVWGRTNARRKGPPTFPGCQKWVVLSALTSSFTSGGNSARGVALCCEVSHVGQAFEPDVSLERLTYTKSH